MFLIIGFIFTISILFFDKFKIPNSEHNSSFYLENPKKTFFLIFLTNGAYSLLWEFRHWKYLKKRAIKIKERNLNESKQIDLDSKISPIFRSYVNLISFFLLVKRIKKINNNIVKNLNPLILYVGYWFLSILNLSLPLTQSSDNINFESLKLLIKIIILILFSFQLSFLQKKVNKISLENEVSIKMIKTTFNTADIIYLFFGIIHSLLFLLAILGNLSIQILNIFY